jgi:hypothetical protein
LLILIPGSAFAQEDCRFLVIASNKVLAEAQAFSTQFVSTYETEIRQSPNKVYANVLLTLDPENNRSLLASLIATKEIPDDAHCSSGNGYGPTLHSYPPQLAPRLTERVQERLPNIDGIASGVTMTLLIFIALFWAVIMAVLLKRAVKPQSKKRLVMRSPDVETLYPMDIIEVHATAGQRFKKGDTLIVFKRVRAATSKRIVAREDGQTVDVLLEQGARLEQPKELLVVQHDNAEEMQEPYRVPLGKMTAVTAGLAGLCGAAFALSSGDMANLSDVVDIATSRGGLGLAGGAILLGLWLAYRAAKHVSNKRKAVQKSHEPRLLRKLPAIAISALLFAVLWIADHGYSLTDDIHWVMLIAGMSALLGLIPFSLFYWQRYTGLVNGQRWKLRGSTVTYVFDAFAVFAASVVVLMQLIEVSNGSSLLLPRNHSKNITATFASFEADLADRLPSLFGPDANDLRKVRDIVEQQERDRQIVAEFNVRMTRANKARTKLEPLIAQAQNYWPSVMKRIQYSVCSEHRAFGHPIGVKVYIETLEKAAATANKFMVCVRGYQQRNSTDLVNQYNSIVQEYQDAAKAALEPSKINRLRPANEKMVSAILEKQLIEAYRAEVIKYVERNKRAASANTKARELANKRRRESALSLAENSLRLQKELDQSLRDALNPSFFNPTRSWTFGNPGTPLSEFEFEDEDGESIEDNACQVDCDTALSDALADHEIDQEIAKSEREYEAAQARLKAAEEANALAAEEKVEKEKAADELAAAKAKKEALAAEQEAQRIKAEAEAKAEAEKKRLAEERRKAEEADDGCYPVTRSCIINESSWIGERFILRLRNACVGRIYLNYCVSTNDGSPECGATSVRPGQREVSPMFRADAKALVRWSVVGSRKMSSDWVCAAKNPDWNSPKH